MLRLLRRKRLIASGRDADVYDLGDGTVLRRCRRRNVTRREVDVMRYAYDQGYPVPRVVSVSGRDLVLEKIEGSEMQDALLARPDAVAGGAAALADLHHRLHRIAAPDWLPQRGDGDRLLHLDLHPRNVLMSTRGPFVIDWSNAARGPAALDPALAIAVGITAKASADAPVRAYIERFIAAFASHFDRAELDAVMPLAVELRAGDTNVTDRERAELAAWWAG